jgi:pimeloyl-ACP methyl ester carboxylesterase
MNSIRSALLSNCPFNSVSSPPFTEKYAPQIMETRLSHLSAEERQEALSLLSAIYSGSAKGNSFARFGDLMEKADSFAPLPHDDEILPCSPVIYQQVWAEAGKMRSSGELLRLAEKIQCPAVAIHGDYDPHPAAGVKEPLARILQDFRFIPLANCGHHPWYEREAKDNFYAELKREIGAHE